ncbi:MAG TPA: STAS domain-containing protein [Planctomycetota bacterium]|jgi:anti-anti-sigma factor
MGMKIADAIPADGGALLIKVSGRVDTSSCRELHDRIEVLFRGGNFRLLIDMSEIDGLCSSGISVLLTADATARAHGGSLMLLDPSVKTQTMLMILGVSDSLSIAPSARAM